MTTPRHPVRRPHGLALLPLCIALVGGLSGCIGGLPDNRSLYSVKQPVVTARTDMLDVRTIAYGLPRSEQIRLDEWLEAMDFGYGDRVSVDGAIGDDAIAQIAALVERRGMMLSSNPPVTQGRLPPGIVRVVLTRSTAAVPDCPDWSANSDANPYNATYPNFGCAINGNMAAMIADPQDLLRGQRAGGGTDIMTAAKPIESYREQPPSAQRGLIGAQTGSQGGNQP
ncbi:CpaD family pilus assembly protein [Croceicoccus hydrothermalis]|uniref:CpaD family pilus assembly protein n=1 Tax=Croceicoccus hydrothermalis TaxID=2867964 RepID=UPI001EFB67B6|nr:CpaD family pilus assembly lipoprotein [Croceicoccus hydrothermalis]